MEVLVPHLLKRAGKRQGVPVPRYTAEDLERLRAYPWPGNVRELQNVLERGVILARGGRLVLDLPLAPAPPEPRAPAPEHLPAVRTLEDLKRLERELLLRTLEASNWKIYGPRGAAERLGMKPTTLISKMKRLDLARPS
ncbi:AAA-type ATPase lid domain-containing protein [Deferrisoma sp.]